MQNENGMSDGFEETWLEFEPEKQVDRERPPILFVEIDEEME